MKLKTAGIILVWLASVGFVCASTNDITTLVQKGLFEEEANHHLDAAIDYYQEAIGHFDKDRQLTATAIFRLGECYRLQGKTNEANVQYQRIVRDFSDQPQLFELSRGYLPKMSGRSSFVQNLTKISDGTPRESPEEQEQIRHINDMIQNSPDLLNAPVGVETPLVIAVRAGSMSSAKLLLDNGANVNPASPAQYTPLSVAAHAGNKRMVEFLLSKGANANALDAANGYTPLDYAIEHGFKTVAETLLAHGANVDVPNRRGDQPLYVAAGHEQMTMAELLLAHKADVNATGKNGETALFVAIQINQVEMVQFLISNKANVNIKAESGKTPLLSAVEKKDINIAIVKALLDSGADVEATVQSHRPLDIAVNVGRTDLVELLLQRKADPNIQGRWNVLVENSHRNGSYLDRTVPPLIQVIAEPSHKQSKIAAILLDHSANPNLADETGDTPLDYAIRNINTNMIEQLILHHADVNAPDKQGDPPLAYVARFADNLVQNGQIRNMLIQAGANEDYQRRGAIFITQKGTGLIGEKVFYQGTNPVNRYTLFELIATVYGSGSSDGVIFFPDFAHTTINRLKADGSKVELAVDLEAMLQSGDCSKNPRLEWGDIVLIPQLDHKINDNWDGITQSERGTLGKCLLRNVKVVVKGQTTPITLLPRILQGIALPASLSDAVKGEKVLYDYDLDEVVHQANVLLISSDISRVKVTRRESEAGGHPLVMEFNLETQSSPNLRGFRGATMPGMPTPGNFGSRPNLIQGKRAGQSASEIQLLDGDIIEIPERDQTK